MFEFDCILLKPCLLQPCFHVAGKGDAPREHRRATLRAGGRQGGGGGIAHFYKVYNYT